MKRLTFVLFFLITCFQGIYATDSLSVRLKVIDCDGSPLTGAYLAVEGISGKTNDEGYFSTKIAAKEGTWATYSYEVYPTGYPYLTGSFNEEDLADDIIISYEHCVKLSVKVSGVYDSSDPYSGSIKGNIKINNSGYSFITTKEDDDVTLWTIQNPVNSSVNIEISGRSYLDESFYYSTQIDELSQSTDLALDIHKDLIKINVNLSEDTRQYGTLEWFATDNPDIRNYTSISSTETLLLNPDNYQIIYSTPYSDDIETKIYSDAYEIQNIPEQTVAIEANPANYHRININVSGVPDTLHRELYTNVESESAIEQYGSDNLYFRNNFDLYLKDGSYHCRIYSNSHFIILPQNVPITVNGEDQNITVDYSNYALIPIQAQVSNLTDNAYLNLIISSDNESVTYGNLFNEQWNAAAFLETGKEYQFVSWLPGYKSVELTQSITEDSEINLNFTEHSEVTKVVISPRIKSGEPIDNVKLTLGDIGEQTVSGENDAVFYNVPYGKYNLVAEHPNYGKRTVEIEVDADGKIAIDEPENLFQTYMTSRAQYYIMVWLDGQGTGIQEPQHNICSINVNDQEISLRSDNMQPVQLRIYNDSGVCLITRTFLTYQNISLDGWAKGIYILKVAQGNTTQTIKFVK